jgi:hypothetical protein
MMKKLILKLLAATLIFGGVGWFIPKEMHPAYWIGYIVGLIVFATLTIIDFEVK